MSNAECGSYGIWVNHSDGTGDWVENEWGRIFTYPCEHVAEAHIANHGGTNTEVRRFCPREPDLMSTGQR